MNQRLFRSRNDRVIAGVAGGLAAMINLDPSLVRILWVILVPLTGGFVILLYLIMAVVVPEGSLEEDRWQWERPWPDPWAEGGPLAGTDQPGALGMTGTSGASGGSAFAAASDVPDLGGPGSAPDDATRRFPPPGTDGAPGAPRPTGVATGMEQSGGAASPGSAAPLTSPSSATRAEAPPGPRPAIARRPPWPPEPARTPDRGVPLIFGLILILIGAFFLARTYLPGIDWNASWPLLLVAIGVALLIGALRRTPRRP